MFYYSMNDPGLSMRFEAHLAQNVSDLAKFFHLSADEIVSCKVASGDER